MAAGFLLWGATFAAFVLLFPLVSDAAHPLPGYALFLLLGMLPWTLRLYRLAFRHGRTTAIAVVVQGAVVAGLTYPVHIAATHAAYWTYAMNQDRLLGLRIGGVPFEEYFFYPLTINLAVLAYLWLGELMQARRLPELPVSRRNVRICLLAIAGVGAALFAWTWVAVRQPGQVVDPAQLLWRGPADPSFVGGPREAGWALVCFGSLACNFLLMAWAETHALLRLRAVLPTTVLFFLICLLVDLLGISRGWWVFNAQQTSGLWVGPLPLENLASYLTGVPLALTVFEGCRRLLGERGPV